MKVNGLTVHKNEDGGYDFSIYGTLEPNEEFDVSDVGKVQDALNELEGEAGPRDKPKLGRRAAAKADEDEEEEKPARGRLRRRASEEDEDKPARGRRRRAASEDEEEETPRRSRSRRASEEEDEDEDEKPVRRRGHPAKSDKKITNATLSKAASEAASVLSPAVVDNILNKDFGVEKVSELEGEDRQAFLSMLETEMEAEGAAEDEDEDEKPVRRRRRRG